MIGSPRNGNFTVSFQSEKSVQNWPLGSLDSKKQVKQNKVPFVLEEQSQLQSVCLPVN